MRSGLARLGCLHDQWIDGRGVYVICERCGDRGAVLWLWPKDAAPSVTGPPLGVAPATPGDDDA